MFTRPAPSAATGDFHARGQVLPRVVNDVVRSGGRALDPALRAWAEPRFGRDFSGVRVHADERAAASAQAVDAAAYTAGQHIVFGRHEFRPDTAAGRHLLAHELAHVAQQAPGAEASSGAWQRISPPGGASEVEAGRAADAVMAGSPGAGAALKTPAAPGAIARQPAANPVSCTAGVNGAPANVETVLDSAQTLAILAVTLAQSNLSSLQLDAVLPGLGAGGGVTMPAGPSAVAYANRFGLPTAAGGGKFRNRLSGDKFPSQAEALVDESRSLSDRYSRISDTLADDTFRYRCIPNPTPANSCGADCSTRAAFGCPSLIMLCPRFWTFSLDAMAQLLIHEVAHSIFRIEHQHGFTHADCYAAFAADAQGRASPTIPACVP